jgi:hypothetical protein
MVPVVVAPKKGRKEKEIKVKKKRCIWISIDKYLIVFYLVCRMVTNGLK